MSAAAGRVIINLARADLRKDAGGFDVPIALGMLVATGQLSPQQVEDVAIVGELALDETRSPRDGQSPAGGCRRGASGSGLYSQADARTPSSAILRSCSPSGRRMTSISSTCVDRVREALARRRGGRA